MVLVLRFLKRRAQVQENFFFLLKFFYSYWNIHLVWQIKYVKNMIRKLVTLILLIVIILTREQTILLKSMPNTLEPSGYWNKSRNIRIACSQQDPRYRSEIDKKGLQWSHHKRIRVGDLFVINLIRIYTYIRLNGNQKNTNWV